MGGGAAWPDADVDVPDEEEKFKAETSEGKTRNDANSGGNDDADSFSVLREYSC